MKPTIDKYGRVWALPPEELCATCGQPDNCGDCTHGKLSEHDVRKLGGLVIPSKGSLLITPKPIHDWGSYELVWACPDCDVEIERKPGEVAGSCYECGSVLVMGVVADAHRVYPFETIEQFNEAFGG